MRFVTNVFEFGDWVWLHWVYCLAVCLMGVYFIVAVCLVLGLIVRLVCSCFWFNLLIVLFRW